MCARGAPGRRHLRARDPEVVRRNLQRQPRRQGAAACSRRSSTACGYMVIALPRSAPSATRTTTVSRGSAELIADHRRGMWLNDMAGRPRPEREAVHHRVMPVVSAHGDQTSRTAERPPRLRRGLDLAAVTSRTVHASGTLVRSGEREHNACHPSVQSAPGGCQLRAGRSGTRCTASGGSAHGHARQRPTQLVARNGHSFWPTDSPGTSSHDHPLMRMHASEE
jgi:hypothetical protein